MPSPPPAPPAVAEDEERPWPPIKMKRFPYAVYCVFGGMGRTGENLLAACVGIHYLLIMVNLLSFYTDGEQARFWTLVSRVVQSLCYASTTLITCTLITCVFIRYYMRVYGEYHVTFDPPQQHLAPAAAAEQLPPPPPEMDMC